MSTPSSDQKAQKQEQGEVPTGPKNEVAPAPGNARGAGNPDLSALVPSVSSGLSPSGGGAPHSGTAGSSAFALAAAGAISINGEGPELPSMGCVLERERADLQGGCSPHAELRWVVPGAGLGLQASHAGGVAAMVQGMRGVGPASGPPTLTASPGKGRGRKQPGREEASQAQKPPGRRYPFPALPTAQCPVPLPPSSPGSQPSNRRRSRASPSGHASQPGPVLRSQARASGPVLRSQARAPGPVLRSQARAPGPGLRSQARAPGPGLRSQAARPGPALNGHATPPGIDDLSRESEPGSARRRRHAPEPGPVRRRRRRRRRRRGARGRGHRSSEPGPAPRSCTTPPGPAPSSYTTLPRPLRRQVAVPGPALRSQASESGPTLRSSASARGPARRRRRRTTPPGPALRNSTTRPGQALRRPATPPGRALSSPASHPASLRRSGASSRSPVLHDGATGPSLALEIHASPPGPTLRSSLAASPGPVLRSHASTLGPVLRSHVTQQRSAAHSLPSPPGLAAQSPSPPGFALRRLVFWSSSDSPDPAVLFFASQPGPAIHASSSSPSSLDAFSSLFPRRCSESFSSSSPGSPGLNPCPSPAGCSVLTSSSSSPRFCGLGSISTPSPASIRRALLPALDALSPISPGEQAEIGSTLYPPIPSML